ncbi:hypothetical protein FGO68_gene13267 [Halteria grandinella]|uniref:Uncharacterized protein n=1 Tax=Halteria grandinella TaxID=5974 RepID=A0A8J8P560_HALGN|nr:hypothetical protein FGO68_gene13267 [Halteria grandinella]
MSFTAEHRFWQRRVEKEAAARNKFIENVFLRSQYNKSATKTFYGGGGAQTFNDQHPYEQSQKSPFLSKRSQAVSELRKSSNFNDNSFHVYEIGKSDPNQILPREFKPHFTQLPGEVHKSTYERLAEITSQTGKNMGIVKRPSQMKHRIEYVNYRAKTSTNEDEHGQRSATLSQQSRRTSLAPVLSKTIQQQQTPSQEYTYDGKKKRKRFNENLDQETIEAVKQAQQSTQQRLTTARLEELDTGAGGVPTEKSHKSGISRSSRSTAILRAIIRKATNKKEGEKSETPSEYKQKVLGLVNELDERQLEKLDRVLEEEQQREQDELDAIEQAEEELLDDIKPLAEKEQITAPKHEDTQSVLSRASGRLSNGTTATMLNKLERQLQEERNERERMRQEIEELKKMNQQLAQSIMGSSQRNDAAPIVKKQQPKK